ncbi:Cytochrome c551 peroxidase [Bienertia sinuspersici]
MFSRGDMHTITLNLAGLKLFSQSTGLEISAAKSDLFCAGVDKVMVDRIQALSGFKVVIWNTASVPKHQFLTWLAFKQRLLTKDRLAKIGLIEDQMCCLCSNGNESHSHLFFECDYSKACMAMLANWVGLQAQQKTLQQLVQRIARNCKGDKLRRQAYSAIINALVYFIWRARNDKMWNNHKWTVEQVVQ